MPGLHSVCGLRASIHSSRTKSHLNLYLLVTNRLAAAHESDHVTLPVNSPSIDQRRWLHLPNPFRKNYNFRKLDAVPQNYELIYKHAAHSYIVYGCGIAIVPAWLAVAVLCLAIYDNVLPTVYSDVIKSMIFDNVWQMYLSAPILLGFAYYVRLILKRCILRMYYDDKQRKFIAVMSTMLPWRVSQFQFCAGQMKYIYDDNDESSLVRLFHGAYAIDVQQGSKKRRRRRYIISSEYFRLPLHYNVMMGHVR